MEIIKTLRLGVLTRPFQWRQQPLLGVSVLALAQMSDAPQLLHEQALWDVLEDALTEGGVVDLIIPKPHAEYLVSGVAFTAHQPGKTQCLVQAQVGDKIKALRVSGHRYWVAGAATAPQPFDALPLRWAHAYGGAGYADNPLGCGRALERVNGVDVARVPNIEAAHEWLTSPRQQPAAAAGFGPLAADSPQRWRKLGTYDAQWLQQAYPGLADNVDWSAFNAAPADQQWPGVAQLPPGLPYQFLNLHPQHAVQNGHLPDGAARCFIQRADALETPLEEIPLRLTTAWFVPHTECVALIYHGCVNAEDGGAPLRIMPAFEASAAPRSLAYYQQIMAQRLHADDGDLHIYSDHELISPALIGPGFDTDELSAEPASAQALSALALQRGMLAELQPQLASLNMTAAQFEAQADDGLKLRRMADLPGYSARLEQQQIVWQAEANQAKAQLLQDAQGSDAVLLERLSADPAATPLPPFDFAGRVQALSEAALDPAYQADLLQQLRATYLSSVQFCGAAPALTPAESAALRQRAAAAYAQDRNLQGWDLTGADLSGMDLRGANLSGALLESANLSGCQLDAAQLDYAVLARTLLSGASLRDASCVGANFSHVRADSARFSGAHLHDAQWLHALLDECDLREVQLSGELNNMACFDCDFTGAQLHMLDCAEVELVGCALQGTRLEGVTWRECTWQEIDATGCVMNDCNFSECELSGNVFAQSRIEACSFGMGTQMQECDFMAATLVDCNWRDTPLQRSRFAQATLKACDVSGADLTGADFSAAHAQGLLAQGTVFSAALLVGANLMQALLNRADLRACNLSHANLFEADIGEAWLDASTVLDHAHSGRTQTWPLRKAEAV